jgi:putative ABC transport system ATP-binding protein
MTLLHDLNGQGATIVVITHDRELAASLPRTVSLLDGRIENDSVLNDSVLNDSGLGGR